MGLGRHLHRWWRPAALAPGMQDGTYVGGVLTSILKPLTLIWSRLLDSARRTLDVGLRTRLEIWEAYLNVYANTMVTRMARAGAGVLRVVFASCAGLVLSRVEKDTRVCRC